MVQCTHTQSNGVNVNLTPRELELMADTDVLGYVRKQNEMRNAQAAAEGWEFWTTMPESEDFLADFKNVYELEHMYACGTYSDIWKQVYCGRPRHAYGHLTLAELEAEISNLTDEANAAYEAEQKLMKQLGSPFGLPEDSPPVMELEKEQWEMYEDIAEREGY